MKDQLLKLFSDLVIVQSLEKRFNRNKKNDNAFEEIYDGLMYKKYCKSNDILKNKNNFSYTFNTDSCQASDSSKVSVWPIFIMIHELPDQLRKKFIIIAGLWVSKSEPHMNVFLEPFVQQANKLSDEGFT